MQYCADTLIDPFLPVISSGDNGLSHYMFGSEELKDFRTLFDKPTQHFIEMGDTAYSEYAVAFIGEEYPHISLTLSTQTAFRQPVAECFSAHLANMHVVGRLRASDIRTCLQEAIMNSIIHGNLATPQEGRLTSHFQQYMENISANIADHKQGRKRISIFAWHTTRHITLCVSDQGEGFTLDQPETDITIPYGRGLPLIRAMSDRVWQTLPNHFYMQFSVHE